MKSAYWTATMLASTAESTWSSSRRVATEDSLSVSDSASEKQASATGKALAAAAAPASEASGAEEWGGKKVEVTSEVLRRRLSSSSKCFFSCIKLARSSDRVSIRAGNVRDR